MRLQAPAAVAVSHGTVFIVVKRANHPVPDAARGERNEFGFYATYEHEFANSEDVGVAQGLRAPFQRRRLTFRYSAPFHLELEIEFLDAGGSNVIGFFLTHEDDETVRIYSTLWRNDFGRSVERMQSAIDFEMAVIVRTCGFSRATSGSRCPLTSRARFTRETTAR